MKDLLSTILLFIILIFSTSAEFAIENHFDKSSGVVKYYNEIKGYGYIFDNKIKDDVFVYQKKLIDEISENDSVVYLLRNSKKGFEAVNVRLTKNFN